MNERIMHVLEFDKVIAKLKGHAATSLGKEKCSSLEPLHTLEEVRTLQDETDEAMQVERWNKAVPLGGVADIRPSIRRAEIGGVLSAGDCLDIAYTLYGARQVKSFLLQFEEPLPILERLGEEITPLRELERSILRCIDENSEILDNASHRLRSIRSSIRTFENRIREKLEVYTKTKSDMLSEAIITIRNDRYVLPVKLEHRSMFGGVVHDQSASGSTLFMEPQAVMEINNQLQEAFLNESEEVERILRELSDKIAADHALLQANVDTLTQVDFIFARAGLGKEMRASKPQLNDEGYIKMEAARHPLIPDDEVVSNDVEIGKDYTAIVITGPNTGGKTVVLKMIGLCTLMCQSGLQIPALDGCEMGVFGEVYADIGDEQSIEQNLSTFSSHMTQIIDIMQNVDHESLVLLDELGAGTDPQEGAALAMSILDEIIERGSRVVATTHYPELKAYGYNRDSVMNDSVEFDVETLQPTYRLLIGVPGRSNAFEISRRLGLHEDIIRDAKEQIGMDTQGVEEMIASLEESRRKEEASYEEAHDVLTSAEQLYRELQDAWKKLENNREKILERTEQKAAKALSQAREEAEMIVEDIREMKNESAMKEHRWIEAKKMLEEAQPHLTSPKTSEKDDTSAHDDDGKLQPGEDIKLLSFDQTGTVLESAGDDQYLIQVGSMKVKADRKDLRRIKQKQEKTETRSVATVKGPEHHVSTELDLRGERYDDAHHRLEKYLDDALLAGYRQVSIIHGKGTGALRKGVETFAQQHPHIASYRSGKAQEGGSGVTVLELQ